MNISVIIPIYNVQEYLPQCLDSLYEQIDGSVEVILVNDGSTDNSQAICEEYTQKFPNTILVNKENGGLSDARNAGTAVATGEYIYYLDSDDWLAPDAIKTLYDFAEGNNCEVVQGGFYYAYDDHLLYDAKYKEPFVLDRNEAMLQLIKNDYVKNFAWGKLYKSEIVKRYPFPKGKYFEDSYWQHLVMNEVVNYGIIPTPLYYYRQRSSGISGEFSIKNLDLLKGYEERLKFVQELYPKYLDVMSAMLWKMSYSMLTAASKSDNSEIKQVFQIYWENLNKTYYNLFEQSMASADVQYFIIKRFPHLMPLYSIYKKVLGKVKPSNRYQIIRMKCRSSMPR
ncbi:MAG: glycosyltransferase family 2 protein [Paludibacteraceae bacterium]|nr:glycosyltransferase family 2 protein [Paludibacteraceae bacterium]